LTAVTAPFFLQSTDLGRQTCSGVMKEAPNNFFESFAFRQSEDLYPERVWTISCRSWNRFHESVAIVIYKQNF
jgi:hypothetical protein